MANKYFICEHCGNIVQMVKDKGVPLMCCGQKMTELVPGTSDGAADKHVPVWSVQDGVVTVKVGSAVHPMAEVHYIEWVSVETGKGFHHAELAPGEAPEAKFVLAEGEEVQAVYAYCNLHGLWKS